MANIAPISLADFDQHFGTAIELSSDALGGSIVSVSDQWFAPAKSLLQQHPAESLAGQFGPNGALYDGWESRRHNPTHDWVIIRLGVPSGTIIGFDIDTTHFSGNEAPASSVFGLARLDPPPTSPDDPEWEELLPVVSLGPSSRHLFKITETEKGFRYIMLNMIPDGGIARFRVYGQPIPVFPSGRFDLASVLMGARVVYTSDQHYGIGSNLILPGRGPANMGGGWETKRSRKPGHSDFVIIKLADKGFLDYAEIDTNYFIGNFPQAVDLYATVSDKVMPGEESQWTEILAKSKLGPHQQQFFQLATPDAMFTHVKMTIYPDGGVKRIRLFGRRAGMAEDNTGSVPQAITSGDALPAGSPTKTTRGTQDRTPILPLTQASFAPYGAVIEAHSDARAYPPSMSTQVVNFGTATKFNHVARLEAAANGAVPNLCLFSCRPWEAEEERTGLTAWRLKGLERHQFSTQTFIPIATHGHGSDQSSVASQSDGMYLIVVALDDGNGRPDMKSVRAFMGQKSQGISYLKNIWHAPLVAIKKRMDFVCVVYETGVAKVDCEVIEMNDLICELDETVGQAVKYTA